MAAPWCEGASSSSVAEAIAADASDLEAYQHAVGDHIAPELRVARALSKVLAGFAAPVFGMLRHEKVWRWTPALFCLRSDFLDSAAANHGARWKIGVLPKQRLFSPARPDLEDGILVRQTQLLSTGRHQPSTKGALGWAHAARHHR